MLYWYKSTKTDAAGASQGNFIQQVLLEESAALIDASGRAVLGQATGNPLGQLAIEALRQQRAFAQQLPAPLRLAFLPAELAIDTLELLKVEKEDTDLLNTASKLWQVLTGGGREDVEDIAADLGVKSAGMGGKGAASGITLSTD